MAHFKAHVPDVKIFSESGTYMSCPAKGCGRSMVGGRFTCHVIGDHLGGKWRCLAHEEPDVKCAWTCSRTDEIAQHLVRTHREHLHLLDLKE